MSKTPPATHPAIIAVFDVPLDAGLLSPAPPPTAAADLFAVVAGAIVVTNANVTINQSIKNQNKQNNQSLILAVPNEPTIA